MIRRVDTKKNKKKKAQATLAVECPGTDNIVRFEDPNDGTGDALVVAASGMGQIEVVIQPESAIEVRDWWITFCERNPPKSAETDET